MKGSNLIKPLIRPIPYIREGYTKCNRKIDDASLKEFGLTKQEVKTQDQNHVYDHIQ